MRNHIRQAYVPCEECDKLREPHESHQRTKICIYHLESIGRLRARVQITTTRGITTFSWAETSPEEKFHRSWQVVWSLIVFIFALAATIFVKVHKTKQYEGKFTWWEFFLCLVAVTLVILFFICFVAPYHFHAASGFSRQLSVFLSTSLSILLAVLWTVAYIGGIVVTNTINEDTPAKGVILGLSTTCLAGSFFAWLSYLYCAISYYRAWKTCIYVNILTKLEIEERVEQTACVNSG